MDMDRTILPSSLEFSPDLVSAVADATAAGITAIIATGRMFASARPYALQLGVTAPVICYQGALVADPVTGEWLLHQPIDVAIALEVIAAVKAEGFHMNVYLDDQLYVEELNTEAITYAAHARLEAHAVGDLLTWLTSRPPRSWWWASPSRSTGWRRPSTTASTTPCSWPSRFPSSWR